MRGRNRCCTKKDQCGGHCRGCAESECCCGSYAETARGDGHHSLKRPSLHAAEQAAEQTPGERADWRISAREGLPQSGALELLARTPGPSFHYQ